MLSGDSGKDAGTGDVFVGVRGARHWVILYFDRRAGGCCI